jgi:hypothetical protein
MSSRPRKASFLRQNVKMLRGLFLCTVGGCLRCGIHLGTYQAHHRIQSAFTTFEPINDVVNSINKTGPSLEVQGKGSVAVQVSVSGQSDQIIMLCNVCYCPDVRDNLISESQMDKKGLEIHKAKGQLCISKANGKIVMEGQLHHNLYEINCVIAVTTRYGLLHYANLICRTGPICFLFQPT